MDEKQLVNEAKKVEKKAIKLSHKIGSIMLSKSVWGLLIFTTVGIIFTTNHLWDANTVDFFKWLGGFFFGSRAADNLTNINLTKGE